MFPPNPNQQMPQAGQPPQQPQAAPPQAGAPPQPGAGAQPQGPHPVDNIGFNQDVQNILLTRIQTLTPQEAKIMDSVINAQTIPVLLKVFPELKPLFDQMAKGAQGGPIGQPGQPQAGQGAPAPGGASDPEDDPSQGGDNGADEEEEDESDNPLTKSPASQGLIG